MSSELELTVKYFKLLINFKSFPRIKQQKTFLEISGYPHYENVCSNILAFYLNPKNEHGLDDLVLTALAKLVVNDFELGNWEDIHLYREYGTLINNRIDILLFTESYAICVENKIFHHLSGNDLAEYKSTIEKISQGQQTPIYIVLSLRKLTSNEDLLKIHKNNFVNITYEQLFKSIQQNIGDYLQKSNMLFVNHLLDFIKTIQNLTSMSSENHELFKFFKENSAIIQELTDDFNNYKEQLFQKIDILKNNLPTDEFLSKKFTQKIFKSWRHVLVHECLIGERYKICVDTCIGIDGWEIQLWGLNTESKEFIFNKMLADKKFLPKPAAEYPIVDKRLIYQRFETETEIDIVATALFELLKRVDIFEGDYNNN